MYNGIFDFNDMPNGQNGEPNGVDYEKSSYGKLAYKRVQRLRRKGQRRGIEIPRLNYELTKPEKPRVAFWIVAVISAALFVGIIVGIVLLYNELIKTFSDLSGIGEFLKVVFDPVILTASFGWSAVPGILLAAVYLLIVVLFVLPIIAAVYFYRFVRDAFYMTRCSKEEFAKGSMISSRILGLVTVTIVVAIVSAILSSYISAAGAKLYIWLIFGGLAVALGGLIALMTIEKLKCAKWFENLEESKKQNYLEHEKALRRVKSRLNTEKRLWNDMGK